MAPETSTSDRRKKPKLSRPKNANGPLSCAECRRLKLRCDRKIPCYSCIKRGCGQICPDGSLTTGQGNRFILASTTELHEKINILSYRVRELEDGLRVAASSTHPLLSQELLHIKAPLEKPLSQTRPKLVSPDIFNALPDRRNDFTSSRQSDVPFTELASLGDSTTSPDNFFEYFTSRFPAPERAARLSSSYFRNIAWCWCPVSDIDIVSYELTKPIQRSQVSLLLMIYALGSHMMAKRCEEAEEGVRYYSLARSALFSERTFELIEPPNLYSVRTLILMTIYVSLKNFVNHDDCWQLLMLAMSHANDLLSNLNESNSSSPDPLASNKEVVLELYDYLHWKVCAHLRFCVRHLALKQLKLLFTGRPFAFLPLENWPFWGQCHNFHSWRLRFAVYEISTAQQVLTSNPHMSCADFRQLSGKMTNAFIPSSLRLHEDLEESYQKYPFSAQLQGLMMIVIRETTLLHLTRRVCYDCIVTDDPLEGPYSKLVMTAYDSACAIVDAIVDVNVTGAKAKALVFFLEPLFSAAVLLYNIITQCPDLSIAPTAMTHLNTVHQILKNPGQWFIDQNALEIISKLCYNADLAIIQYCYGHHRIHEMLSFTPMEYKFLERFGGQLNSPQGRIFGQTNTSIIPSPLENASSSQGIFDSFPPPIPYCQLEAFKAPRNGGERQLSKSGIFSHSVERTEFDNSIFNFSWDNAGTSR